MTQDLAEDIGCLDRGDDGHASTAARACEHVEFEDPPHEVCPTPIAFIRTARRFRAVRSFCHGLGETIAGRTVRLRGCFRRSGFARRRRVRAMRYGARPRPSVGREYAVVQDEVDPRAWGQGGELLQELDRCEQEVGGAVVPLVMLSSA